jgi:hypothetical protein
MMGGEIGLRVKKTCGRWRNWESRSGENPGKWTNEPERRKLGSMCNALFGFRMGRESVADRGLTRCSSKMQQRIWANWSVVSCSLPGSGVMRAQRFSSVEGVSQGVVRLREAVAGEISRKVGNGERSRKVAKPQKGTQRIL